LNFNSYSLAFRTRFKHDDELALAEYGRTSLSDLPTIVQLAYDNSLTIDEEELNDIAEEFEDSDSPEFQTYKGAIDLVCSHMAAIELDKKNEESEDSGEEHAVIVHRDIAKEITSLERKGKVCFSLVFLLIGIKRKVEKPKEKVVFLSCFLFLIETKVDPWPIENEPPMTLAQRTATVARTE